MSSKFREVNGKRQKLIICPYVVRNGVKIFPKKGKYFAFWVDVEE